MTPEDSGRKARPKDRPRKRDGRASDAGPAGRKRPKGGTRAEPMPVRQNKAHHRAVMSREKVQGRAQGTPFEAYFASAPLPQSQPTLIFEHLQKTAGTAMRQIIHANLIEEAEGAGADRAERNEHVVLDVPKGNKESTPLKDWYERWWGLLDQDRRDRLVLATSHSANYLLDLIERPTRAFTVIREPVDRVMSRYYFYSTRPNWTLRELYQDPAQWPQARQWFFNYQTRALLEPHYDVDGDDLAMSRGAPPNADLWRERLRSVLEEHYVVGVQEYFVDSVKLFAAEFGWQRLMAPRARINRARPREFDDDETRQLILDYNWLDAELYDQYAKRMQELASTSGQGAKRRARKGEKARREPADRSAKRKRTKRERRGDLSADEAVGASGKAKGRGPKARKRTRAEEGAEGRKRPKRERLRDRPADAAEEMETPPAPLRMWDPVEAELADPDISLEQNRNHRRALSNRGLMKRERGGAPRETRAGTPFEAYFASAPLPDDQPTLVFEHLQKTAGTAMRQIIHANLIEEGEGEAAEGEAADVEARIEHMVLDMPKNNRSYSMSLKEWYQQWWDSLDEDRRSRLILATSHSANYLLELIERPARAFTIVREPVDRVLSRYYFYGTPPNWTLRELYANPAALPRTRTQFFNYQSRALLEPRYDVEGDDLAMSRGAPPNADLWRERLSSVLEQYVVGIQDHFVDSVRLFAAEFGWRRLMAPRVRINRTRPRELEDEETRQLILDYNWLDAELYDQYAKRMEDLPTVAR